MNFYTNEEPIYRQVRDERDFVCTTTSTTAQTPPELSRDVYLPPRLDGGRCRRRDETNGDLQVGCRTNEALVDGLKRGIDSGVGSGLVSGGITDS